MKRLRDLCSSFFLIPLLASSALLAAEPDLHLQVLDKINVQIVDTENNSPVFLSAEHIRGGQNDVAIADVGAQLRKPGMRLDADRIILWQVEGEAWALGHAHFVQGSDHFFGDSLRLDTDAGTGTFLFPRYVMPRTRVVKGGTLVDAARAPPLTQTYVGSGQAHDGTRVGEDHFLLNQATFTTCETNPPDWYLEAKQLDLDYSREQGTAYQSHLMFKDVPVLYTPWFAFPLGDKRRSGFLTPTYSANTTAGLDIALPWYWDIAPNMDAIVTPRLMSKRGMQLITDTRYLFATNSGQARLEWLPADRIYGGSRYAYALQHSQTLPYGFSGSLNLNGVSDNDYFANLSRASSSGFGGAANNSISTATTTAVTPQLRQGVLSYSANWWSASLTAQSYQIIQDALHIVSEPYSLLPSFSVTASRADLPLGGQFEFSGTLTQFQHSTLVNGLRSVLAPQVSLPLTTAWFELTPKAGLWYRQYHLGNNNNATFPVAQSSAIPFFSADAHVTFERDMRWFDQPYVQTLEPRLFYVYIPYRDQSRIPVFDTGLADFNFAQIFSENRYSGSDRIGDANQLTAAVTSRILDPGTGEERLRGTLAQRFYYADQRVTLPGETARSGRYTDLLASLSGVILPKTYLDTAVQYNQDTARSVRNTIGLRYQPEPGKVLSISYRYQRDVLDQIDLTGQWPITPRWRAIGRYNYSFRETLSDGSIGGRLLESLVGIEYDAGCWAATGVARRVVTTLGSASTALYFQIEFKGLGPLGMSPQKLLERSIPGYWKVQDIPQAPSAAGLADDTSSTLPAMP